MGRLISLHVLVAALALSTAGSALAEGELHHHQRLNFILLGKSNQIVQAQLLLPCCCFCNLVTSSHWSGKVPVSTSIHSSHH